MDIEGSVKVILETQSFNSGFQKREFVITTKEQYPQDVKFELIKDRIDIIDAYKPGETIKVHFNIRGNEYNGKYYVNLQAWRIENVSDTPNNNAPSTGDAGFPDEPPMSSDGVVEDDLPF
tara:strand:+ start:4829 stop:5188 length:360 start_codon:yes stop_codon:yes gene_type:complete